MVHSSWLVAGAVLALVVWQAQVSAAQPYGAIVYDHPTGSWGASYNEGSQRAADEDALGKCQKFASHCGVVVRFWGELCAAYATGADTADGRGTGATHTEAEKSTIAACSARGDRCEARVWSCNSRGDAAQSYQPGQTKMCRWWDARSKQYVTGFCVSRP